MVVVTLGAEAVTTLGPSLTTGFGATGAGAALAAGAATIPTAALELAGAGLGRRAQRGARAATESAEQAVDTARDFQRGTPTEATIRSGTEIIQDGTPEQVAKHKSSYTGKFLAPLL